MKPWYASKTVWFNSFVTVMAGLPALMPTIRDFVTPAMMNWLMFAVGVINLFLRGLTSESIK